MFETLQNPAMISMVGPTSVEVASDYTLGAMYAHEMLLFCGLFAMIISILHVIGHTRKEEDLGLTELVRSFQVGRQANSFAAIAEVVFINVILALFIAGVMVSFSVDTISIQGSFLFGSSVGMAGIIGAGIGLVMAQIMPTSSSATGSALGVVGLLYIVRAGTDVSNVDLSMINPMGWTYLTYPFTENNWMPLIFALIFSEVVIMIAFVLEGNREMGAGYLPDKEGRAYVKRSLLSVQGLFVRLNRGAIIGLSIGFLIMGAAYGSIYGDMQTFLQSNEIMQQMFTQAEVSLEESFTSTIIMVMVVLVSILPIVIINKLFAEENRSHLSQIFSTKVSRTELYWTTVGLAIFAGVLGTLLSVAGLGGTALSFMESDTPMGMMDFFASGFNLWPSVLFYTGLSALIIGWAPGAGKLVYVYLAYSFMLSYFGGIVDFPDWFSKTAIQNWLPQMPVESFDFPVFITITAVSIVLMVIGYIGYKRRDMAEGA